LKVSFKEELIMKVNNKLWYFILLIIFIGCEKNMNQKSFEMDTKILSITSSAIDSLAAKRIFFGHRSVGFNIIDGLKKIITNNDRFSKLHIYEYTSGEEILKPGIYHASNGENSLPKSKCDAFKNRLMENNLGSSLDIAFFKFCYVDIKQDANVQDIFDYYVKTIENLKNEFNHIKFVHVTIPLFVHTNGIKDRIKKLFEGDMANIKRNQFNELLKGKYENVDPIYDLAKVESTYPDGSESTFSYKNNKYYSLINQYTNDGGHLNELGQHYAAKEFLRILAEVSLY